MVPVPEMGDSITEGSILEWTVGVGDYVQMDDVVVVIETDKVVIYRQAHPLGTGNKLWLGGVCRGFLLDKWQEGRAFCRCLVCG